MNVDGAYSDGCECADLGFGKSCGTATVRPTVAVGGTQTTNGNVPAPGEENWLAIPFAYTTATSYHPHLTLTPATGTTMLMDVMTGCVTNTTGFACNTAADVSTPQGLLTWDIRGGGDPGAGTQPYSPTPSVGTVFVRIYQTGGTRTCAQWQITATN